MNVLIRIILIPVLLLLAGPVVAQRTTEPQPMGAPGESNEPPRPNAAPVPVVRQQALPRGGGVLVFGGTEGIGLELVKVLAANHNHVTVVTEGPADDASLSAIGVTVLQGNTLDTESMKPIFTSAPFRAVVSTIGERHDGPSQDFTGNKNIFDIAKASSIPRVILVSAIGAGDSDSAPPWYVRGAMKLFDYKAVTEKTKGEEYLRKLGLDYTIVRPGGTSDRPASGKAVLTPDNHVYSQIGRTDLANLLARCVDDDTVIGKTLSAYDPTRVGFLAMFSHG